MANRNFPQSRVYSNHIMPVSIDAIIAIGASGAPTIATGNGYGIASITRMAAGQYRVQLQDNYMKLLQFNASCVSPVSGSGIAATALTPGLVYQIVTMGTTTQANWETAGLPAGITAAVGVVFLCAATSSGTGTGKVLGSSGIVGVELLGVSNNMLNYRPADQAQANLGAFVDFQCMGGSFAGSALAAHNHNLVIKGGQAAAGTDAVSAKTVTLGKESATDITVLGANSATAGGVVSASAGTPAGTITSVAADPASGSSLILRILLSNSSVQ